MLQKHLLKICSQTFRQGVQRLKKPSMEYFDRQYRLSYLDWLTAVTQRCRDDALDAMFHTYNTVVSLYGVDEADSMQRRCS